MNSFIMFILWLVIQYIFYSFWDENTIMDCTGRTKNLQKDSAMMNVGSGLCGISFFLNVITFGQCMVYTCIPGIIGILIYKIYEHDTKKINWK